ncbi:MAG: lysophospholipid acyltransferase family protein [Candidatus Avoscillospira sp.]
MISKATYCFLYIVCRIGLFFYHPFFRVVGREHVPKEGRLVICANHSGLADPIWVIFGLRLGRMPRIMAKKEAMQVPILGPFLKAIGIFGVDRSGADVSAVKTGLKCLRDEQALLVFPEGTRVRPGKIVEPKRGALMLATRTDSPVLPVYLSTKRFPFGPMRCVIGESYRPEFAGAKPTDEEMDAAMQDLMARIYRLGEQPCK